MKEKPVLVHKKQKRKFLIITDDPAVKYNGKVYSTNSVNLFWIRLAEEFNQCRISMPLKDSQKPQRLFSHQLFTTEQTSISRRSFYFSKVEAILNPIVALGNVFSLVKDVFWADSILYRLPSVFLPVLFPLLYVLRAKKDVTLYIVGDFYSRNASIEKRGVASFLRKIVLNVYNRVEMKAASTFKVLATGEYLVKKYSAVPFDVSLISMEKITKGIKKINNKPCTLLFVGRLDWNKGVDVLLEAVRLLDQEAKGSTRAVIVGSGVEMESLKALSRDLKIDHRVEFTGGVSFGPELERYFAQGDIFILPSRSEGVPKVLYEAMATGLPIVASNVGGVPAVTENGRCAYLVEPDSPDKLKEAVKNLVKNRSLRKKIVESGTEKIIQNTMEKKIVRLVEMINGKAQIA